MSSYKAVRREVVLSPLLLQGEGSLRKGLGSRRVLLTPVRESCETCSLGGTPLPEGMRGGMGTNNPEQAHFSG